MGDFRSVIDEYAAVDSASLTDSELEDDVVELAAVVERVTALLAERSTVFTGRGGHQGRGFVTPVAWLASITDMERSGASRLLAYGRTMSDTRAGRMWRDGDLSGARFRMLASARRDYEDVYRRDEELLLEYAGKFTLRDLHRVTRHWVNCADATRAETTVTEQIEHAFLHVSSTMTGMVRVDGLLDPVTGETFLTALDTVMTVTGRDRHDRRPASNRRVEALAEISRQWLDQSQHVVGGRKPHVNVIIDVDTLTHNTNLNKTGGVCETEHVGTITPETARRVACDSAVTRIITGGPSQILDVGRVTRTVSPAQRTALTVRDRHCRFVGCERPANWCDAHHLTHWADGGPTNLDNLILLCRRHHHIIHTKPTRTADGTVMLQ